LTNPGRGPAGGAHPQGRFDYTTIGHVTVDVMSDGSRRPGGSAFYSALQAARLGRRALILTRGAPREIDELMEPYRAELELEIQPAEETTTLETSGSDAERSQRVLAWAGAIAEDAAIDTAILHLAPVARELPRRFGGSAGFLGLTPQGLARAWTGADREILPAPPDPDRLPQGLQAMVLSVHERDACAALISRAQSAGALVAITAGGGDTTILRPGERPLAVAVPPVGHVSEDVGAGDVFAAAFFVALAEGQSAGRAADFANAAAAVRIAGSGAQAIGDRTSIEGRLRAVVGTRGP
jgi:1D-myo-inositol 3-kinase